MEFILKHFQNLSTEELYDVLQLRAAIFVVEQNCAYNDLDDKDRNGLHLLGYENNKLIAYARILPQGISYKEASIGRVVVDKKLRGKSVGKELMLKAIELTYNSFNTDKIIISGQQYLEKFYNDLGFVTEGEPYMEDFIPHLKMSLTR